MLFIIIYHKKLLTFLKETKLYNTDFIFYLFLLERGGGKLANLFGQYSWEPINCFECLWLKIIILWYCVWSNYFLRGGLRRVKSLKDAVKEAILTTLIINFNNTDWMISWRYEKFTIILLNFLYQISRKLRINIFCYLNYWQQDWWPINSAQRSETFALLQTVISWLKTFETLWAECYFKPWLHIYNSTCQHAHKVHVFQHYICQSCLLNNFKAMYYVYQKWPFFCADLFFIFTLASKLQI